MSICDLGLEQNPLMVAIIGAGPSGFYVAEALIKADISVRIDLYESLPSPYGLVRTGVAPDHPKLKQVILLYDKIAEVPQCNFIGNVTVGRDITVDELKQAYHALVFCCGAETDRKLGIPGEDLTGSHTATEFVGWYNGHPNYRDRVFDLSYEVAVVIGQGNVAADVARILSKTVDELKHTDIAQHALEVLAESRLKEIYVIGRRGPAQAKFTAKELREFSNLKACDPVVDPAELQLNPASEAELAAQSSAASNKVYKLFQEYADHGATGKDRRCYFQFLRSPVEMTGGARLKQLVLEKNRLSGDAFKQSSSGTGMTYSMDIGILFRSIGYRGIPITGVPFHDGQGIFPNEQGRIKEAGQIIRQMYTAGWIKRGPNGIIGTNRACSVATVDVLLSDLKNLNSANQKHGGKMIYPLLTKRRVRYINFGEWKKIDAKEIEIGQNKGKPREKYTSTEAMLAVLKQ